MSNAPSQDVMQVCHNGHVITDLLLTCPEQGRSHCERCGAPTLERCSTCGHELPGAIPVPGMTPIGGRQPPQLCPTCGAAFPWTEKRAIARPSPLALLETFLRRVPLTIRQLRSRHGTRPPLYIEDVHDLEDLLRTLLPLHFDDIRPECRTPRYAPRTRTDLLLAPERIVITCKRIGLGYVEEQLRQQIKEDVEYYERRQGISLLLEFLYDPEQRLIAQAWQETSWLTRTTDMDMRCVVAQ
jgi:hypothetical protein